MNFPDFLHTETGKTARRLAIEGGREGGEAALRIAWRMARRTLLAAMESFVSAEDGPEELAGSRHRPERKRD